MNLTPDQKKSLVSASVSTVAFVLCDEVLFRSKSKAKGGKTVNRNTWLYSVASGAAAFFLYDKASPEMKQNLDQYAPPAGAAAASFIAVNRFVMPKVKPGKDARPYALGAAAIGAYFANKELHAPSTPTVGRLPVFEPINEPIFEPPFPPEFEG